MLEAYVFEHIYFVLTTVACSSIVKLLNFFQNFEPNSNTYSVGFGGHLLEKMQFSSSISKQDALC